MFFYKLIVLLCLLSTKLTRDVYLYCAYINLLKPISRPFWILQTTIFIIIVIIPIKHATHHRTMGHETQETLYPHETLLKHRKHFIKVLS